MSPIIIDYPSHKVTKMIVWHLKSKPLYQCVVIVLVEINYVVLQVDVSDREAVRKAALTTRTQMGEVCRSGIFSLFVIYFLFSLFVN